MFKRGVGSSGRAWHGRIQHLGQVCSLTKEFLVRGKGHLALGPQCWAYLGRGLSEDAKQEFKLSSGTVQDIRSMNCFTIVFKDKRKSPINLVAQVLMLVF